MKITRRQAREWAIQMLTAADLNPPLVVDAFIEDGWRQTESLVKDGDCHGETLLKGGLRAFAEERVRGVLAGREQIDAILTELLEDWDLDRLGTVERAVLRLGVWELMASDVPPAVVINEAIDLVNWFSSPRSRTLVNGVLDRYAKKRAAGA